MSITSLVLTFIKRVIGVDYAQSDKMAHSWLGAAWAGIALLAAQRLHWVPAHWYVYALVGVGTAAVVGALKEWSDYYHPKTHTVDFYDFLATTLGGILPTAIFCWPWHF